MTAKKKPGRLRRADASPFTTALARVDEVMDGTSLRDSVPSGFPSVDRVLGGGLRRGDLVVLGGDIGAGKSALALAAAVRAAQEGREVVFYTGETSVERVAERILAIEGRARVDDLRRGALDDATRATVGAAAVRLRDVALTIERMPPGAGEVAADLGKRAGVQLVVVDPLQMLASGGSPQDEELASAVRRLKRLAVDVGVALLVTAHLPRHGPRADPRPQLDDFGALGAVKQHADVVLGLFREGMYDATRSLEGATELHVLKNRSGPTAYADLYFYAQWMRFEDLVDPDR
ncbi:MAG: DnaB helicase C-terminal domain-containing protein [Gemmatimonadota bacterium]|nr:DnaB helicase C-terminal domain-containing protein [Gemmatimonadota bacterium]